MGASGTASLREGERHVAVTVLDIAEGGVLLRTEEPFARDLAFGLTFALPGTAEELQLELVTSADSRVDPSGSGLSLSHCRFTAPPLAALWSIVAYCMAADGASSEADEVLRLRDARHSPGIVELHAH